MRLLQPAGFAEQCRNMGKDGKYPPTGNNAEDTFKLDWSCIQRVEGHTWYVRVDRSISGLVI